jgi:hypothetical protein
MITQMTYLIELAAQRLADLRDDRVYDALDRATRGCGYNWLAVERHRIFIDLRPVERIVWC